MWPSAFRRGIYRPAGPRVVVLMLDGDRKHVGFLKRVRDTEFARRDSRIYSPLCLLLGLGAAAIVVS